MPHPAEPTAGAERPRRRREGRPFAGRVGSFLIWWVLLMAFWVWIDDSIALAELLVGAGVAVLGALVAEVVQYQAASHIRIRFEWLALALPIPLQVLRDLEVVFAALFRQMFGGQAPPSALEEVTLRVGGESASTVTRRVLLVMGTSVAPNTFALGVDKERGVMIVHRLVSSHALSNRG